MVQGTEYDAVVVGSGPNGLSASITLAKAGCSVLLLEGKETIGGGTRTMELTLPGFMHDVCSAIHPIGSASPVFKSLNLTNHGLEWVHSPAALAHPLDDGTAITLERSISDTAKSLGIDSGSYIKLMNPLVQNWEKLVNEGVRNYNSCFGVPFLIYTSGDGKVFPCGMFFDHRSDEFLMGDLLTQSLKEIYESDRYWDVVKRVSEIDVHKVCYSNCRTNSINDFLWKFRNKPKHVNFI